jgi:glucose-6-phosphate isomerase
MKEIQFDFNNLFSLNVGHEHGVEDDEVVALSGELKEAYGHLKSVCADKCSRQRLSLEWTQLPFQDKKVIRGIRSLAGEIASRFDAVVFLGIGGSYLGLKAAQEALSPAYYNEFAAIRGGKPRIYFEGNNLDPETLSVLLKALKPKKTFLIVISKSGETTETKAAFLVFQEWLRKGAGKNYGRQIVAITDPAGGSLRQLVEEGQKKDPKSFRNLPLLKGVGGRFSEFNMGLLHLALMGVNIQDVLDGAAAMSHRCWSADVMRNPACMYAALHTILYRRKNKDIAILMPFSESLKSTADWYVQLLAESLGKKFARRVKRNGDGTEEWEMDKEQVVQVGRTPVSARGTNDLHSIQQNNVEGENNKTVTFIRVEQFRKDVIVPGRNDFLTGRRYAELLHLAQEATEWALVREKRPNCSIIMPQLSAYHWGGLLFFFEMATAWEGELLQVNAFDQPGVEGYKHYMFYKLGKKDIPQGAVKEIQDFPLLKEAKYIF